MGKIEKAMFCTILATLALMLLLSIYRNFAAESEQEVHNVSVLVRDASDRFLKGVEQAALDYNVDIHLVSGYEAGNGQQQYEYLQRELENDTDAVVLAAEEPSYLEGRFDELLAHTPIITVEERLSDPRVVLHVGVDDMELGSEMGKLIAKAEAGKPCTVICPFKKMPHIDNRLKGLRGTFIDLGVDYSIVFSGMAEDELARALAESDEAVLVVLDEDMLLLACSEAEKNVSIYGIGYVSGARPYLENGRIKSLLVYSEYDTGYMSVREAVFNSDKKSSDAEIVLGIYAADADSMYISPLEEILFPIG